MTSKRASAIRDLVAAFISLYAVFAIMDTIPDIGPAGEFLLVASLLGVLLTVLFWRWRREQGQVEAALGESEQRYQDVFENAGDMVYTHDLDGHFTSLNKAGERLIGMTDDEARDVTIGDVLAPQHKQWPIDIVAAHARGQSSIVSELQILTQDGRRVPVEVATQLIHENGHPIGLQGIARDINERKRLEQQTIYLASHDPLTDLYNRRRFEEELQLQIARTKRTGTESALLFMDLDHFKDVNDSLGHRAGDELLQEVAGMLLAGLREVDIVARLGGDEFTMILPSSDIAEAREIADRILESLRGRTFTLGGQPFKISASLGIAMIPRDGATAAELLSNADLAMYQAKESGRNRHCTFSEENDWQAQIATRMGWRTRISKALEDDQFRLYAQPILDLRTNEIAQYELLLRMANDDGSTIDAAMFIESAERFGWIHAIDQWAVRQAIRLIAVCERAGQNAVLEVNISGRALGDSDLLKLIRRELDETSADPRSLVLEVTESAAIDNLTDAQHFVSELKEIGCRFALDDFGAGFSSFHQLKKFDADYLKIDGSFISNLATDQVDQHLVKAMVEVARALGKQTIAEYASDDETITLLREFGVDYAQGHHIGRPREASSTVLLERIQPEKRMALAKMSSREAA